MNDNDSTKGREATPLPTPLMPPSKNELLTAITEHIIEACGGDDGKLRDEIRSYLTVDCQPSWEEEFRKIIDQWYLGYPEINILNILDEQIKKWRNEGKLGQPADQSPDLYTAINKLIWEFRLALGTKYKSIPPEIFEIKCTLKILKSYPDYPFDEKLDRDLISRAIRRFPDVDLVEQIDRKIIWWQEHPEALKAENKSPRTQLWGWFELEDKYQQNKQKKDKEY